MLYVDQKIDYVIEKYKNMVYRIAINQVKNQADAEDIFQDVFLKYITYISTAPNLNPFANTDHEKAWLIRVTINCCKSHLGSSWNKKVVPLTEDVRFHNQHDCELLQVVLKLPHKYRTVIHLYYYEDLSVAEISKLIDVKENTVREQLTRARRLLEKYLKGDFDHV